MMSKIEAAGKSTSGWVDLAAELESLRIPLMTWPNWGLWAVRDMEAELSELKGSWSGRGPGHPPAAQTDALLYGVGSQGCQIEGVTSSYLDQFFEAAFERSTFGRQTESAATEERPETRGPEGPSAARAAARAPEDVNEIIDCRPERCSACSTLLAGSNAESLRQQVAVISPHALGHRESLAVARM